MRRKHFTNWIPFLNILSDWSTEYRFFAKHAKLLLNMNLLNYSFISFNILRVGSYSREFVNLFTKFKGASNLGAMNSYFRSFSSNKLNVNFLKNSALLHVSSTTNSSSAEHTQLLPLYLQSQNLLYAPNSLNQHDGSLYFLQNLAIIYNLSYNKELYKVLTLLCLTHVIK